MAVFAAYQNLIKSGIWQPNSEQAVIVQYLSTQAAAISKYRIFKNKLNGAYLWGGVGTGKSCLLQLFYDNSPIKKKQYWTCHQLLKFIEQQLTTKTILQIAKQLGSQKLLCIDEFEINDISTVMLLNPVIQHLLANHTYIILTSNHKIRDLYLNGLQRNHLVPTLNLMESQLTELELHGKDYRPEQTPTGHYIISNQPDSLSEHFIQQNQLLKNSNKYNYQPLVIANRKLEVIARNDNILWLDFNKICNIPRCIDDYHLLATQAKIILIDNLTPPRNSNQITNFIHLIDIIYHYKIKLIIAANTPIDQLCPPDHSLYNKFKRTRSRLTELCKLISKY